MTSQSNATGCKLYLTLMLSTGGNITNRHSCTHFDSFSEFRGKLYLDEIILDLFSGAHTGESQTKSRNHDLPKCVPEGDLRYIIGR